MSYFLYCPLKPCSHVNRPSINSISLAYTCIPSLITSYKPYLQTCTMSRIAFKTRNHKVLDMQAINKDANSVLEAEQDASETQDLEDDDKSVKISPYTMMGRNRIGLCSMPKDLDANIMDTLPSVNKSLRNASQAIYLASMSQSRPNDYSTLIKRVSKKGTTNKIVPEPHAIRYDKVSSKAYLSSRAHAAYGAADFVFRDISRRIPDFQPTSILDFGTGPGTAIWAAKNSWPKSLETAVGIDSSEEMLEHADKLSNMPDSGIKDYKGMRYLNYKESFLEHEKHDLVVASFVIGELTSDLIIKATLKALWDQTRGMLVLIDRGTPNGFRHIAEARAAILEMANSNEQLGAHVVSPCSHEKLCPLLVNGKSWCHFSQRVYRNEVVRSITGFKSADHEDIKFSYVAIRRGARPAVTQSKLSTKSALTDLSQLSTNDKSLLQKLSLNWSRVTAPPIKKKKHVIIDMCSSEGQIQRVIATKLSSPFYKDARKLHWGDQWPHPPTSVVQIRAPNADPDSQETDKRGSSPQQTSE
ncbi:37S ribosomal protein S22 [Batrachochytrium dendrobatidis]